MNIVMYGNNCWNVPYSPFVQAGHSPGALLGARIEASEIQGK